jgi:hypothetical protein
MFLTEEMKMKTRLMKILGIGLVGIGIASVCSAQVAAPEIDPASGVTALAVLGGALLIIRSRRK